MDSLFLWNGTQVILCHMSLPVNIAVPCYTWLYLLELVLSNEILLRLNFYPSFHGRDIPWPHLVLEDQF